MKLQKEIKDGNGNTTSSKTYNVEEYFDTLEGIKKTKADNRDVIKFPKDIQAEYVKATWLQTAADISYGSTPDYIAVLHNGWIYSRTPTEIWGDIKPSGGIPKTDLASGVQSSLNKADSALQAHQSLAGYATEAWVTAKGYGTYSLPAGGIPENQLASEVQTKLNSGAGLDYITYDISDHPSGGRTRRCRRWNSGLQEHWYSIPMNNVAINTAFGSMFRSEFEGNHAYMKAFVSGDADGNPISEVSWQAASGSNPAFTWMADPTAVTGSTSNGPGTVLSMTPKFGLVRPDNTTVSGIATIYTRGYWK